MAAKRFHDELSYRDSNRDPDVQPSGEKRMRRLPSFATVIREAVMVNSVQNVFHNMEPMLRKVVAEEVDRALIHHQGARKIQRLPQMLIEQVEESSLQLVFKHPIQTPIFTSSKIEDKEGGPLQLLLIDTSNKSRSIVQCPSHLRVQIVVIDGEFPGDRDDWSVEEFNEKITKERAGKRPLIVGDVNVTLRNGAATIDELQFTDNSSWIRGRHFRIAARVEPGSYKGPRIKEAMTDRFPVKDHRGEVYKKHYPPALEDDVWRLDRIGKDGAFHKKLFEVDIKTVQDFLKLSVVDPGFLRNILGLNMSDKMWEGTLRHARTCQVGDKLYAYHRSPCTISLNSICELVGITIDGLDYKHNQLNMQQKACVQQMIIEAYQNWNQLEDTDQYIAVNSNRIAQSEPAPQYTGNSVAGTSAGLPIRELDKEVATNTPQFELIGSMEWPTCSPVPEFSCFHGL